MTITYNEFLTERKTYLDKKRHEQEKKIHLPILEEDMFPLPVNKIYPYIVNHIKNKNNCAVTRGVQKWEWKQFTQYLCQKYNVEFIDAGDECQCFILHRDGSYTEV